MADKITQCPACGQPFSDGEKKQTTKEKIADQRAFNKFIEQGRQRNYILTNRPLLADENGVPLVPIKFYSPPGVI